MNVISRFCLIFLTLGFSSAKGSIEKKPLMPASEQATTLFSERSPAEIGVTFVNPIDEKHGLKRLYISGFAAGGFLSVISIVMVWWTFYLLRVLGPAGFTGRCRHGNLKRWAGTLN